MTPTCGPVLTNTVHPLCAQLPAARVAGPRGAWPLELLLPSGPECAVHLLWAGSQLTVLTWQARLWLPAWGELPFAKLDNTRLSVRGLALWLHVLMLAPGQARPARQREGKAWLQPELAGGRAGGGRAGPGPCTRGCLGLPPRLPPEPAALPGPEPACQLLRLPSEHLPPGHVEL